MNHYLLTILNKINIAGVISDPQPDEIRIMAALNLQKAHVSFQLNMACSHDFLHNRLNHDRYLSMY